MLSHSQRLPFLSFALQHIITISFHARRHKVLVVAQENLDYTCFPQNDYKPDNQCQTIQDGICDDPAFGGSGGDACRNQDCIDCNIQCQQFSADCYGCLKAKGCYYCPGDGTCENSNLYVSTNKVIACENEDDFYSNVLGDTPDICISDTAYFKDPLYEGSKWMYDAINIVPVWEKGLTGKGITVRINDDGVFVDNREFEGRFDNIENSCSSYLPKKEDTDGHGTAVAGVLLGNANNDLCAAGVAPEAKFSSCNYFANDVPYSALAFKVETFDISQNSIGLPACGNSGLTGQSPEFQFKDGCPFQHSKSKHDPCKKCEGEFVPDAVLSNSCVDAIAKHCKDFFKLDGDACADFPAIAVGGSCNYDKLPRTAIEALNVGIQNGRNGKGTIFTFASGNDFVTGDDVNFSAWTNSRYTITVGAVGKDMLHGEYSTGGAALMVSAPGGAPEDYGHLMTAGLGVETCSDSGQGTSFACPVVSGVIALMLEANPELTWRDVQGIIATTSQKVDTDALDNTQTVNGAGIWHSNWYGFGIIDAKAAVDASEDWVYLTEELQAVGESGEENAILSDDVGNEYTSKIDLNPEEDRYPDDFIVESTVILLDLSHYNRGDLEIELSSPSGTKSILHPGKRPENTQLEDDERWKLMTLKNWGENPTGEWKLTLRDLVDRKPTPDDNVLRKWQLIAYGRSASGQSGFGGINDEEQTKSEYCLDPGIASEGCVLDAGDSIVCPAGIILTLGTETITLDADIVCPNDVTIGSGLSIIEASQRGLCSCDAGLYDGNCDVIEADMGCDCILCPEGSLLGISYTCQKPIYGNCGSIDCSGSCVTNEPSMSPSISPSVSNFPTIFVEQPPTVTPSYSPSLSPTATPSQSPTENPTLTPTEAPSKTPTFSPSLKPSNIPSLTPSTVPSATPSTLPSDFPTTIIPTVPPVFFPILEADKDALPLIDSPQNNLSCEQASPITTSGIVVGNIRLSPVDNVEGPCISGLETVGGWYEFIGNGQVFVLDACPSKASTDVAISIFTGECSTLKCYERQSRQIATCENGYSTSWVTETDQKYYVLVSGLPIGSNTEERGRKRERLLSEAGPEFQLRFVEEDPPSNSMCGVAVPVSSGKSTQGMTVNDESTLMYNTCEGTEKPGAWYSVAEGVVSENGVIVYEASTCNSDTNFYSSMSVFRGKCNDLECVDVDVLPCDDDQYGHRVYWTTSTDEEFKVFVHGADDSFAGDLYNAAGSFTMDITYDARLTNDQCTTAIIINPAEETPPGSTKGVRPDIASIESSSCGAGSPGAWYRMTGTGGVFQASTCSDFTDHNTSIHIYSGECGRLSCIARGAGTIESICSNPNAAAVNFKTQANVRYYILVTGRTSSSQDSGSFGLTVTEITPPDSNECTKASPFSFESKASPFSFKSTNTTGTTLQATIDFPQGVACGVPLDTPGVWYKVEGTGKGIEIRTCGVTDYDSAISIFKGTSCGDLECITGTSAPDPKCRKIGVKTAFRSEASSTYYIYVHGDSKSSRKNMGTYELFGKEFDVLASNQFCVEARTIPTDGSRIQGSTEDATRAAIQTDSCGIPIKHPGLWYTFKGTGQPFTIWACDEDLDDLRVSVSVFKGNCDDLQCVTGFAFEDNTCTTLESRLLQPLTAGNSFRLMTENREDYYLFVHGQNGVGDFDLFVQQENLPSFGTAPPSPTPNQYGKDLYRWTPINFNATIDTDYLSLTIITVPSGNVKVSNNLILYTPPLDFFGRDTMTVDGCIKDDCFRFDVIVDVSGDESDYVRSQIGNGGGDSVDKKGGFNKLWLLLLVLLFVPCILMSVYVVYWKKQKIEKEGGEYESEEEDFFEGDDFLTDDQYESDYDEEDDDEYEDDEEVGSLLNHEGHRVNQSGRDNDESDVTDDDDESSRSDEFSQEESEISDSESSDYDVGSYGEHGSEDYTESIGSSRFSINDDRFDDEYKYSRRS